MGKGFLRSELARLETWWVVIKRDSQKPGLAVSPRDLDFLRTGRGF